eukprot:m51a1_g12870 hypothetical protein (118) ;mRNA; r:197-621
MRRRTLCLVLLCAAAASAARFACVSTATGSPCVLSPSPPFRLPTAQRSGSARAVAERTLQALVDATPEFGKDVEMRLVETTEDPHVAGWSITTHQQTIDGIPIVGAVLKVQCPLTTS